jgi:hypothetical protein
MGCSEQSGLNYCRLSSTDGQTEYEGQFVAYGRKRVIPSNELKIDARKTREN